MPTRFAVFTIAVLMLALAGCDAGPNTFSKQSQRSSEIQLAQSTFSTTKERK